jgi:FdhE protein
VPTVKETFNKAAKENPELASYFEFQHELFELQVEAMQEITATLQISDQGALQSRLSRGLPLLSLAQLPIEAERFAELAAALVAVLLGYYSDLRGQPFPATSAEWLALARRRFEKNQAGHTDEFPDTNLTETAADLALRPYLVWAGEQILPHVDQAEWRRGYCPVCGGAPDFALLEEETGARRLVCARCDTQWHYHRLGCPFCNTKDYSRIVYYPSEDGEYRLYVCQACQRYLKTLDLRKAPGGIVVPVERITSVDLDMAAREQGYR